MALEDPDKLQQQSAGLMNQTPKIAEYNNNLKKAQEAMAEPHDIGAQLMQAGDNMIQQSFKLDAKPDAVDWGWENAPKAATAIKGAASSFWNNIRNLGTPKPPPPPPAPITDPSQVKLNPLNPDVKTARDSRINATNDVLQNQPAFPSQVKVSNLEGAKLMRQYAMERNEDENPELLLSPQQVRSLRVASGEAAPIAPNVASQKDDKLRRQQTSAEARVRQQELADIRRNAMPAMNRAEIEERDERNRFDQMSEDFGRRQGQQEIDERERRRANPSTLGDRFHNFWETMPNPITAVQAAINRRGQAQRPDAAPHDDEGLELEEDTFPIEARGAAPEEGVPARELEGADIVRHLNDLEEEAREIPPDADELEDIAPEAPAAAEEAAAGEPAVPPAAEEAAAGEPAALPAVPEPPPPPAARPPFDFAKATPLQYKERYDELEAKRRRGEELSPKERNELNQIRSAAQRREIDLEKGRHVTEMPTVSEEAEPLYDISDEGLRAMQGVDLGGLSSEQIAALAFKNYMLSTRGGGGAGQIPLEQARSHYEELERLEDELISRGQGNRMYEAMFHATNKDYKARNTEVPEGHGLPTDEKLYRHVIKGRGTRFTEDHQVAKFRQNPRPKPFNYHTANLEQMTNRYAALQREIDEANAAGRPLGDIVRELGVTRETAIDRGMDIPNRDNIHPLEQQEYDRQEEEVIRREEEARRQAEIRADRERLIRESGLFEESPEEAAEDIRDLRRIKGSFAYEANKAREEERRERERQAEITERKNRLAERERQRTRELSDDIYSAEQNAERPGGRVTEDPYALRRRAKRERQAIQALLRRKKGVPVKFSSKAMALLTGKYLEPARQGISEALPRISDRKDELTRIPSDELAAIGVLKYAANQKKYSTTNLAEFYRIEQELTRRRDEHLLHEAYFHALNETNQRLNRKEGTSRSVGPALYKEVMSGNFLQRYSDKYKPSLSRRFIYDRATPEQLHNRYQLLNSTLERKHARNEPIDEVIKEIRMIRDISGTRGTPKERERRLFEQNWEPRPIEAEWVRQRRERLAQARAAAIEPGADS